MKIGFLGFGEVASTFSIGLMENGVEVSTCVNDRSPRTIESAKNSDVKIYNSYKTLAEDSDILISSVVPSNAFEVAKTVSKYCKGIYVDMNNVSPRTVKKTLGVIENGKTVDAAIIGSVMRRGFKVKIIASGPFAPDFSELNHYGMDITVVGSENGQASEIKLLRSAYTKGVSALLFEILCQAKKFGVDREVLKYISETEGNDFIESTNSRITSAAFHAGRRFEEMEEIIDMFSDNPNQIMTNATAEYFKLLSKKIIKPDERPDDYIAALKLFYKD